jgi:hypothetical protein
MLRTSTARWLLACAASALLLCVEAEGHAPVETRFRLDPWQPALFHAEVDPRWACSSWASGGCARAASHL